MVDSASVVVLREKLFDFPVPLLRTYTEFEILLGD